METVFPEKKCMGVFCGSEKSDVRKNGTGQKNSISVCSVQDAEQWEILKRP